MKSRLLLLVLFLGVVAIAVGWVYQSTVAPVVEKEARLIRDDIDYFLTGVHYRELNSDGELSFEFRSPRLEHYPLNDVSSIEVPSMRIYTESDPWSIDSLSGEYEHASNRLHLSRQVVMQRQGESPLQVYAESAAGRWIRTATSLSRSRPTAWKCASSKISVFTRVTSGWYRAV
jgi:LPS export ABC transporter protein LptC